MGKIPMDQRDQLIDDLKSRIAMLEKGRDHYREMEIKYQPNGKILLKIFIPS